MARQLMIQPETDENLKQPYPYYIFEDGSVGRQDAWRGDPAALLGFQKSLEVQHVDLLREDWWGNPREAVGMYPVFVSTGGRMWALKLPVVKVAEFDSDTSIYRDLTYPAYIEAAPAEPVRGGDVGGDNQVGESWCRRFTRPRPDDSHDVITVYFYVSEVDGEKRMLRLVEYIQCTDPSDPGCTEIFADEYDEHVTPESYAFWVEAGGTPTDDVAFLLCAELETDLGSWCRFADGTL